MLFFWFLDVFFVYGSRMLIKSTCFWSEFEVQIEGWGGLKKQTPCSPQAALPSLIRIGAASLINYLCSQRQKRKFILLLYKRNITFSQVITMRLCYSMEYREGVMISIRRLHTHDDILYNHASFVWYCSFNQGLAKMLLFSAAAVVHTYSDNVCCSLVRHQKWRTQPTQRRQVHDQSYHVDYMTRCVCSKSY